MSECEVCWGLLDKEDANATKNKHSCCSSQGKTMREECPWCGDVMYKDFDTKTGEKGCWGCMCRPDEKDFHRLNIFKNGGWVKKE